ncbi:hypothetical protein HDV05_003146 [Chytridiales sp. JEL 0842]|nr:hypothetical protein HDV05_003146 [Chytridiales sp. JEL 0842]
MPGPFDVAGLALSVAGLVLPYILSTPDRTEFVSTSSGSIYGRSLEHQWIWHDDSQSGSYDQPYPYFGWLNWWPGAEAGNAKWIEYRASTKKASWFCLVRFDYRLDQGRRRFAPEGGTFPAGALAQMTGNHWYHAGYQIENYFQPGQFEWQTCAWVGHRNGAVSAGFWFDVPFFSDLLQAAQRSKENFNSKWGGVNGMFGFYPGVATRQNDNTGSDASEIRRLTEKVVYGNSSAIELCTIPGALGPSYVSLTELKFCNLTTLELSDVDLGLPAGRMINKDQDLISVAVKDQWMQAKKLKFPKSGILDLSLSPSHRNPTLYITTCTPQRHPPFNTSNTTMSDSAKEKLAEFSGSKPTPPKPTNASIFFPEIAKELAKDPTLTGGLKGLFIITVFRKGIKKEEWYLLLQGRDVAPTISTQRPMLPSRHSLPVVVTEVEDNDILNFITGGQNGLQAYVSGKVRILGDLQLALQLQEVFVKTGGVEKVMKFLKDHNIQLKKKGGAKL